MSIIHQIVTSQPLYNSDLENFLYKTEGAACEHREGGVYYFYIRYKSTRGMDITIQGEKIEIRNTVLSNRYDYELTNQLVDELTLYSGGLLLNEDRKRIKKRPLFSLQELVDLEQRDCELIQQMSAQNEDIAIYGPVRRVHFGKQTHKQLSRYSRKALPDKMFELIQHVNYGLLHFKYGDILQYGNDEGKQTIVKVLTNKTDCIIDKYDYLFLHNGKKNPIAITNQILNTMLPKSWELVDEYTIVAPIVKRNEWRNLLEKAKEYDLYDEVMKQDVTPARPPMN